MASCSSLMLQASCNHHHTRKPPAFVFSQAAPQQHKRQISHCCAARSRRQNRASSTVKAADLPLDQSSDPVIANSSREIATSELALSITLRLLEVRPQLTQLMYCQPHGTGRATTSEYNNVANRVLCWSVCTALVATGRAHQAHSSTQGFVTRCMTGNCTAAHTGAKICQCLGKKPEYMP